MEKDTTSSLSPEPHVALGHLLGLPFRISFHQHTHRLHACQPHETSIFFIWAYACFACICIYRSLTKLNRGKKIKILHW